MFHKSTQFQKLGLFAKQTQIELKTERNKNTHFEKITQNGGKKQEEEKEEALCF